METSGGESRAEARQKAKVQSMGRLARVARLAEITEAQGMIAAARTDTAEGMNQFQQARIQLRRECYRPTQPRRVYDVM